MSFGDENIATYLLSCAEYVSSFNPENLEVYNVDNMLKIVQNSTKS